MPTTMTNVDNSNPQPDNALLQQMEQYVNEAGNERFADGMDSRFGNRVRQSIADHGSAAVNALAHTMLRTNNRYETGEELLRQMGLIRDAASHDARLRLLTDSLKHPEPRIRDAAGLGLSFLDDATALPLLSDAHSAESEEWLRDGLGMVIAQLEQTAQPRRSQQAF